MKANEELTKKTEEFEKTKEDLAKKEDDLANAKQRIKVIRAEYSQVTSSHHRKVAACTMLAEENRKLNEKVANLEKEKASLGAKLQKDTAATAWQKDVDLLQEELKLTKKKLESAEKGLEQQKKIARGTVKEHNEAMEQNGKYMSEKLEFEVASVGFIYSYC